MNDGFLTSDWQGRPLHYLLGGESGREPIACHDLIEWAEWFEAAGEERVVALDRVRGVTVSTVFLGTDYNHLGEGEPILFETALWNEAQFLDVMSRYSTWSEAEQGHAAIVGQLRSALPYIN